MKGRRSRLLLLVVLFGMDLPSLLDDVHAQVTLPMVQVQHPGCLKQDVEKCKLSCEPQYYDARRHLCPCYSKLSQCLVEIGCSMKQKYDIFIFCTRKGYCKDGYCKYRAGDLTPKIDTRPEVFELTSVKAPGTPCVDNCCPADRTAHKCKEDPAMAQLRNPGRQYRRDELLLPPRQGDPRLGVNQDYDRMPYSIPVENLPE